MMYDASRVERAHLAINKENAPISLRPKECPCGRKITARQLAQHAKCETCVLTSGITAEDLVKLQHMLGATAHHPKGRWGFRNHYCCGVQDRASMERLMAAGLARAGAPLLTSHYFHATLDGCRAVGLNAAGIRRALGDQP